MEPAVASPGGPRVSVAKKRRLAALEKTLGAPQQQGRPPAGAGSGPQPKRSKGGDARSRPAGGGGGGGDAGPSGSGASASRGSSQQQQQQDSEPVYARLSPDVTTGPLAQALQLPEPEDGGAVVGQLLQELMATNPRAFDARAAIGLKMADRAVMLDNPAAPAGRRRPRERRLSRNLASKKQQRQLGLYNLAAAGLTYEQVLPLHQRWRQYIAGLLAGVQPPASQRGKLRGGGGSSGGGGAVAGSTAEAALLHGADLHGCLLRVVESDEARWRGVEGVVVRDTQQTFVVITKEGRVVALPKRPCVFEYGIGRGRAVRLLGRGLVEPAASRRGRQQGR